MASASTLSQDDVIEHLRTKHGTEQWLTVYESERTADLNYGFFCALVPNGKVEEVLKEHSWDFKIGEGKPGELTYYPGGGGKEKTVYCRFGDDDGLEPLLIYREFHHGMVDDFVEVAEEFRHFHDLYPDAKGEKLLMLTPAGDVEEVVRISPKKIQIRLSEILSFLARKEMHLALYFDSFRYSQSTLAELSLKEMSENIREPLLTYNRWTRDAERGSSYKSISRVLGKKLLPGVAAGAPAAPKQFESYAIAVDQHGKSVIHTCDPDKLADYFGGNKGSPHYLTPVFFRREVLEKYYANPKKYSVEDGYLRCGSLWGLRMDNDHEKHVVVFLGDLGQDLFHNEQLYWKTFNIPPDGKLSETCFRRGFLAQFASPKRPDLAFKLEFKLFGKAWAKRVGWPLFKPLSPEDSHCFTTLRVPLTDDPATLDQQALSLAKIVIDSLNEVEIAKQLKGPLPPKARGITKLECWLRELAKGDYKPHIEFLRNLYGLRNGAGHRKGEDYERAAAYFQLQDKSPGAAFEEILKGAVALLGYLRAVQDLPQED